MLSISHWLSGRYQNIYIYRCFSSNHWIILYMIFGPKGQFQTHVNTHSILSILMSFVVQLRVQILIWMMLCYLEKIDVSLQNWLSKYMPKKTILSYGYILVLKSFSICSYFMHICIYINLNRSKSVCMYVFHDEWTMSWLVTYSTPGQI